MPVEKEISVDKFIEEARAKCEGPCIGTGTGFQIVHAACPDPCDPAKLTLVRDRAKNNAWAEAQEACTDGKYCSCHGSYNALIPEQCVPIKDADGRDVCLYFAAYAYVGRCGYWF